MAYDLNVVALVGNLTADMELKYTQSGVAIGTFSIAVNYRKGNEKAVSYFNCKCFGKQAESLKQYLRKGQKIALSGSLQQERYTTKDGQNRSVVIVVCDSIELLGGHDKQDPSYVAHSKAEVDTSGDTVPNVEQNQTDFGFSEDSIPF